MKKTGILNSDISKVLADMGHTDQLTIADCGLPISKEVSKIDLSLKIGSPKFIDVLEEILKDMEIEKIYLAEEIKENNSTTHTQILSLIGNNVSVEYIPHKNFKELTTDSKAIVRTGEASPFANIILQSNVIF